MEIICADCGCLVDRGIRVKVCGDPTVAALIWRIQEADAERRREKPTSQSWT
jgi:hypothetical protein